TPELVFYAGNTLLEGPFWEEKNNLLFFVSIDDEMIYRFNEETTEITSYPTNGPVGAVVLDQEGNLISAEKSGIYLIKQETGERTFLMQPNEDERLRYNDGKLDPKGRFLIGTMGYEGTFEGASSLYAIEDSEYKEVLSDLTLSNGLGWSEDGETFYHIDTPTHKVKQYDYDLNSAEISNGRIAVEIPGDGAPDGLCVDIDGHLWVAEYGGKRVCKWNPNTGEKLDEISMPVTNITSCCIGGADQNYLYITTAQKEDEALSVGLFRVKIRQMKNFQND